MGAAGALRGGAACGVHTGRFAGAIHQESNSCFNPADNGTVEQMGVLAITQAGTAFSMNASPQAGLAG